MSSERYKISFCTVCMNRLHHLKQTLPINVLDNEDYEALEFVLLDYNSTDGLGGYISENFGKYLENGRLIYYKTRTPKYFNRSHSRNLAFKLASGDIICNIDADNYTGKGFAEFVNTEFNNDYAIVLTAVGAHGSKTDTMGRVCVAKNDFYTIRGYDERMVNYGFEDYDLVNRLELNGLTRKLLPECEGFFKTIPHYQKERLANEYVTANLQYIFLHYLTPSSTDFLFLFKDKTFRKGIIVENAMFKYNAAMDELKRSQLNYEYSILQDSWIEGKWRKNKAEIHLEDQNMIEKLTLNLDRNSFTSTSRFYRLSDPDLIQEAVMLFSQISNRILMDKNKLEGRMVVNVADFGKDVVYKNYNYQNPIAI